MDEESDLVAEVEAIPEADLPKIELTYVHYRVVYDTGNLHKTVRWLLFDVLLVLAFAMSLRTAIRNPESFDYYIQFSSILPVASIVIGMPFGLMMSLFVVLAVRHNAPSWVSTHWFVVGGQILHDFFRAAFVITTITSPFYLVLSTPGGAIASCVFLGIAGMIFTMSSVLCATGRMAEIIHDVRPMPPNIVYKAPVQTPSENKEKDRFESFVYGALIGLVILILLR